MSEKPFATAKITARMQIALPKKLVDILGEPEPGDYILFFEKDGDIFIKKGKVNWEW